jgi:hypothetical protein
MPITINGSGTVTGITAGGLPDGVITTDDIAAGAVTNAKVNASAAIADSKLTGTTCKAFVNFNGTGTVAIRASYNVSSITDNGTGDYTVNFTSALVDANFNAVATPGRLANNGAYITTQEAAAPTTSSVRFRNRNLSFTQEDCESMCVAIFR